MNNLQERIMNLPSPAYIEDAETEMRISYKTGHKDALDAAAELALKADACIEALRDLDKRLRECSAIPASAADAYDSFYQRMVSDALGRLLGDD